MVVNTDNLEIGEGTFSIKVKGATPDNDLVEVGICEKMEFNFAPKTLDVYDGRFLNPVDSFIIEDATSIKINLKEDTLRNLVVCMGGDPSTIVSGNGKTTYVLPGGIRTQPFMEAFYEVEQAKNKTKFKSFTFYKCKANGKFKYAFERANVRVFTLELIVFSDPDHAGSPGTWDFDEAEA